MKNERLRYILLGSIVGCVFLFYIFHMMRIQIAQGEDYAKQAVTGASITQTVSAARGEIVDCNGTAFTANSSVFDITVDSNYFEMKTLNSLLLRLITICRDFDHTWIDELPITAESPYRFTEDSETEIAMLKKKLSVSENATVDDVIYWLRDTYNLFSYSDADVLDRMREKQKLTGYSDEDAMAWYRNRYSLTDATDEELILSMRGRYSMFQYTDEQARLLAGIRYTMTLEEFSAANPYTFATDVSDKMVAYVKEHSSELPGVNPVVSPVRQYLLGSLASHVLGVTGSLSAEDYTALKEEGETYSATNPSGYRISDIIGRSGIEKAYEKQLRGENGQLTIVQDQSGNVLRAENTVEAVPGNTVMLTLDQNVQRVAQTALADRIALLNTRAPGLGREADAGAVVAINVKTGGVIAMATYPNYDLSQYYDTYDELVTQNPSPLINRATQGLYTVGSTYKPAVAVAGLDSGSIDPSYLVRCTGIYTYYNDYQPKCEGVHGSINVIDALRVSCNTFFYDLGRRMGIEAINEYSYKLGLGHTTGIEIPESAGQLSSPETREAIGQEWYPSYDMQSAIGQLDNQFTILQMASYAATLANRGNRMQVHLVDKVWDYNMENVLDAAEPTVVDTIEADASVWDTVREGMIRSCYAGGTSWGTWGTQRGKTWSSTYGVDITVAGKTGSPQVANNLVNSVFICYAPADDPEIAVAVIIEKGYEGDRAAPVAKAVLTEYFFGENGTHRDEAIAAGYIQVPSTQTDVPESATP